MPGALDGVRVIDLTRILGGPYATQILGDHGADVLKIEPPAGDDTRLWGPPFTDGTAAYFNGINRNKRGAVLDLTQPAARDQLRELLATADVLIENYKPGTLERWGLGRDALAAAHPCLIHVSITGFGADGPLGGLPGYDAAIQAASGLMSINGHPDGPPTRLGVPIVDMVTGMNAAMGILLALHERERSGRGQWIDIALFDCAMSILHPHSTNVFAGAPEPGRSGNAHPSVAPYDTFRTATAPIFLAVGNNGQFIKLCRYLGNPALAGEPGFRTNADRCARRGALKLRLESLLAPHTGEDLVPALLELGVPCGPVLTVPEALSQPHAQARGVVVDIDGHRGVASPIKLSRTPPTYRLKPPPKPIPKLPG